MTFQYNDDFVDKFRAEGMARGMAQGLLIVLTARGLPVSEHIRDRVLSCRDLTVLKAWGVAAATADNLGEVFGSAATFARV